MLKNRVNPLRRSTFARKYAVCYDSTLVARPGSVCLVWAMSQSARNNAHMFKRTGMAVVACLVFAGAARAESLDDVKNKIHDMVSKYKSIQFKMKMNNDTSMAGFTMKMDSDMALEAVNKGETWMSHTETKVKTLQKMGDQEQKSDTKMTVVDDGAFVWTLSETPDKAVTKSKHDGKMGNPFDPKSGWKMVEESFKLELMPDETVDGKPMWVIAMEPKDPSMKMMVGKSMTYYDKKTGIAMKTVTNGADGKKTGESVTTDVKINDSVSADRFKFTPPAGVEVQDMTKMEGGMRGMGGAKSGGHGDADKGEEKPEAKGDKK